MGHRQLRRVHHPLPEAPVDPCVGGGGGAAAVPPEDPDEPDEPDDPDRVLLVVDRELDPVPCPDAEADEPPADPADPLRVWADCLASAAA